MNNVHDDQEYGIRGRVPSSLVHGRHEANQPRAILVDAAWPARVSSTLRVILCDGVNTAITITNYTAARHDTSAMTDTMDDNYGETSAFTRMEHGHKDMVGTASWNSYGTRCATGSADGKLKVFDRQKDGTLSLCDTWSAHNAEVLEVRIV